MLTKMRSDFWKCACDGDNYCAATCTKCGACGCPKSKGRPATNIEVLIAWLSADDERRKEIEIASRPTKAGIYTRYWTPSLPKSRTLFSTHAEVYEDAGYFFFYGERWEPFTNVSRLGHAVGAVTCLWEPIE